MTNGEFLEEKIEKIWNLKISKIIFSVLFIVSLILFIMIKTEI